MPTPKNPARYDAAYLIVLRQAAKRGQLSLDFPTRRDATKFRHMLYGLLNALEATGQEPDIRIKVRLMELVLRTKGKPQEIPPSPDTPTTLYLRQRAGEINQSILSQLDLTPEELELEEDSALSTLIQGAGQKASPGTSSGAGPNITGTDLRAEPKAKPAFNPADQSDIPKGKLF